jgi:hypothetical protein
MAIERSFPIKTGFAIFSALIALVGCNNAQQDYGGFSRSLGGDIGSGYNNSIGNNYSGGRNSPEDVVNRGTYPKIETSFKLKDLKGDPFDFEQIAVFVTLSKPDGGKVDVPAFYDGDSTWRMRFTPTTKGRYAVDKVKINKEIAREEKLEPKEWNVNGDPTNGFVRMDRGDKSRFIFDNGTRFYPIGHNQGWRSNGLPDIPEMFEKMSKAGENWSRVWMCNWDGKNLDWSSGEKKIAPGQIDLEAAKRWDSIVESAEKQQIFFQLVLHHHGQVSSKTGYKYSNNNNAQWETNPWNAKNGGFLNSPEDFFTDPKARRLTKRKLYYILARWGYSPNVLAWELFNEVEGTDAGHGKLWPDIAMWHREMTLFLRQFDGYHHLITTSAANGVPLESPVWETVDYLQTHLYPPDVLSAAASVPAEGKAKIEKPHFIGEYGALDLKDPEGHALHQGLWASLMRNPSGSAMYWDWDNVEKQNLYSHFRSARDFADAAGLSNQGGLISANLPVETSQKASLRFAPGGGWSSAKQNEFVVGTSGAPPGIDRFPSFLQGQAHRDMMPKPLTLQVNYTTPGRLQITVASVAKSGGTLVLKCGAKETRKEYPVGKEDYAPKGAESTLSLDIPAGAQTITLENPGKDWLVLRSIELTDYAPALAVLARMGKEYAVAWVYHRANLDAPKDATLAPATGKINLQGLKKGKYKALWWNTQEGKSLDTTDFTVENEKQATLLATPPVNRDIALYVTKEGAKSSGKPKGKR